MARVTLAVNPTITLDGVIYTPVSGSATNYKVAGLTEDFPSDTLVLPSTIANPEDPSQVFTVTQIDASALPQGVIRSLTAPASLTMFPVSAIKNGAVEEVCFEEGSKFTTIDASSFQGNKTLKKIYLPDSIMYINRAAFNACSSLTTIRLPARLSSMQEYSFSNCKALTELILPEGMTIIGQNAFDGCTSLEEVTIPSTVGTIRSCAFMDCTALKQVTVRAGVGSIDGSAFSGCTSLSSVTLEEGLWRIQSKAFKGCPLESVDIPASVSVMFADSFPSGCVLNVYLDSPAHTFAVENSLPYKLRPKFLYTVLDETARTCSVTGFSASDPVRTLDIPETIDGYTVTAIGSYAFGSAKEFNSDLRSVTLPATLKSIGDYAFARCVDLESVVLPKGLESIGTYAFECCHNLIGLALPEGLESIGAYAFDDCISLASINLPSALTSVGNGAFRHCASLTSVVFPEQVIPLSPFLFQDCSNLASVNLPEGTTAIPDYAFRNCSSLNTLTLPDSLKHIGEYAFADTGLISIDFPEGLKTIGNSAFQACSLREVQLPGNLEFLGSGAFSRCHGLTEFRLPDNMTSVPWRLLDGCRNLKKVILPEGVTVIENFAFRGASSLTDITLPEGLTTIGDSAFADNTALTDIILPEGLTTIGSYAFSGNTALTGITLPEGLTTIGSYAFSGNTALTGITLPEGLTTIGSYAFSGNTALTSITLPEGLTTIGSYAFSGDTALTDITLPGSLTTIDSYAFSGNTSLTSITLPEGLTTINDYAFSGDTALTSITLPDSVSSIAATAFDNCPDLILKVPRNSWAENFALRSAIDYRIVGYMPTALSAQDVHIIYGESTLIPVTLTPAVDHTRVDGGALTFVSADPTIAYVDQHGLVKGRKPGTTTVYVKSVQNPFINATVTVTVTDLTASRVFARARTSRSGTKLNITYGAVGGTPPYTIRVSSSALPGSITKTDVDAKNGEVVLTAVGTVGAQKEQTVYVYVTVTDANGESDTATAKFQMTKKTSQVGVGTPRQQVTLVRDAFGNVYYRYTTVYDSYTTVTSFPESHISDWPGSNLISKITLSKETIALKPGDSHALTATTTPGGGDVVWISSDYNIADISESGVVTALTTGTATISCCAVDGSGTQAQCAVNCIENPVTAITITEGELDTDTLTQQMTAVLTPEDASFQKVTWSISTGGTKRATIDENGLITWKEAGSALVTATATDGSGVRGTHSLYWKGIPVEKILPSRSADNPMQLAWRVEPENATNSNVTFTVDMPALLRIDETGHMTYLGDGTAHVRLTAADGSGVTAMMTIDCFYHPEHSVVTIPASAATCTEVGNSGGSYCEVCGDVFRRNIVTPALGHSEVVTRTPVAATADADGHTIEIRCERCDECLTESVSVSSSRVVRLPASLTTLEAEALTGVSAQQIEVPEGMLAIGSRAFAACRSLRLVILPDSLTSIAQDAFADYAHVMLLCSKGSTA